MADLFDQAGALVADSIDDFEDLMRLAVALEGRRVLGPGLGVVSNAGREGGAASRLASLWRRGGKAWVAVVDGGALFDTFAAALEAAGIPTFRSADRAARMLARYASWRIAHGRA